MLVSEPVARDPKMCEVMENSGSVLSDSTVPHPEASSVKVSHKRKEREETQDVCRPQKHHCMSEYEGVYLAPVAGQSLSQAGNDEHKALAFHAATTHTEDTISLGSFPTKEEAAKAWDKKALDLRGPGIHTNFPCTAKAVASEGLKGTPEHDRPEELWLPRLDARGFTQQELHLAAEIFGGSMPYIHRKTATSCVNRKCLQPSLASFGQVYCIPGQEETPEIYGKERQKAANGKPNVNSGSASKFKGKATMAKDPSRKAQENKGREAGDGNGGHRGGWKQRGRPRKNPLADKSQTTGSTDLGGLAKRVLRKRSRGGASMEVHEEMAVRLFEVQGGAVVESQEPGSSPATASPVGASLVEGDEPLLSSSTRLDTGVSSPFVNLHQHGSPLPLQASKRWRLSEGQLADEPVRCGELSGRDGKAELAHAGIPAGSNAELAQVGMPDGSHVDLAQVKKMSGGSDDEMMHVGMSVFTEAEVAQSDTLAASRAGLSQAQLPVVGSQSELAQIAMPAGECGVLARVETPVGDVHVKLLGTGGVGTASGELPPGRSKDRGGVQQSGGEEEGARGGGPAVSVVEGGQGEVCGGDCTTGEGISHVSSLGKEGVTTAASSMAVPGRVPSSDLGTTAMCALRAIEGALSKLNWKGGDRKTAAGGVNASFPCSSCGKAFESISSLYGHMSVHSRLHRRSKSGSPPSSAEKPTREAGEPGNSRCHTSDGSQGRTPENSPSAENAADVAAPRSSEAVPRTPPEGAVTTQPPKDENSNMDVILCDVGTRAAAHPSRPETAQFAETSSKETTPVKSVPTRLPPVAAKRSPLPPPVAPSPSGFQSRPDAPPPHSSLPPLLPSTKPSGSFPPNIPDIQVSHSLTERETLEKSDEQRGTLDITMKSNMMEVVGSSNFSEPEPTATPAVIVHHSTQPTSQEQPLANGNGGRSPGSVITTELKEPFAPPVPAEKKTAQGFSALEPAPASRGGPDAMTMLGPVNSTMTPVGAETALRGTDEGEVHPMNTFQRSVTTEEPGRGNLTTGHQIEAVGVCSGISPMYYQLLLHSSRGGSEGQGLEPSTARSGTGTQPATGGEAGLSLAGSGQRQLAHLDERQADSVAVVGNKGTSSGGQQQVLQQQWRPATRTPLALIPRSLPSPSSQSQTCVPAGQRPETSGAHPQIAGLGSDDDVAAPGSLYPMPSQHPTALRPNSLGGLGLPPAASLQPVRMGAEPSRLAVSGSVSESQPLGGRPNSGACQEGDTAAILGDTSRVVLPGAMEGSTAVSNAGQRLGGEADCPCAMVQPSAHHMCHERRTMGAPGLTTMGLGGNALGGAGGAGGGGSGESGIQARGQVGQGMGTTHIHSWQIVAAKRSDWRNSGGSDSK